MQCNRRPYVLKEKNEITGCVVSRLLAACWLRWGSWANVISCCWYRWQCTPALNKLCSVLNGAEYVYSDCLLLFAAVCFIVCYLSHCYSIAWDRL